MSPVTVGALYDSNTISKAATSFDKKKKKKKQESISNDT
jgi:hypothetical protein